jgi:hypothetical protein
MEGIGRMNGLLIDAHTLALSRSWWTIVDMTIASEYGCDDASMADAEGQELSLSCRGDR